MMRFATVRITARDCTEECYAEVLDYLCAVLEQEEFPRSYSVEFRGSEKNYLPIPGLPKKGVNQFFACAVQYPKLHADIERYARLAMREYEWYNNLSDESCAMPGTFAVFALGLEGEQWAPLVTEYLDLCDDEHSSLQEKFLHALIRKFGFSTMDTGGIGSGRIVYAVDEACQGIPQSDCQCGKPGCSTGSQVPLFRLSPVRRK